MSTDWNEKRRRRDADGVPYFATRDCPPTLDLHELASDRLFFAGAARTRAGSGSSPLMTPSVPLPSLLGRRPGDRGFVRMKPERIPWICVIPNGHPLVMDTRLWCTRSPSQAPP